MQAIKRMQRVWVISPDFWGGNFLSKHNYAIEFSKKGYDVYFIEPSRKNNASITVSESGIKNLSIVSHGFYLKGESRLPYFLRVLIYRFIFSSITKKISKPDILLNFDSINYKDFSLFNAKFNVQFFVDLNYNYAVPHGLLKANLMLTVSTTIQDWFKQKGYKVPIMIGHGLNEVFEENAKKRLADLGQRRQTEGTGKIRLAYFGSLFQSILDKKKFIEIIEKNPAIAFDIIGPYNPADLNHGGMVNDATLAFIEQLRTMPNVQLHGTMPPSQAVPILNECDGYLFLWENEGTKDVGNSHKILEYLSFGKAIYSTIEFSLYDGLLCTSNNYSFERFVNELSDSNRSNEMKERINFALGNTYASKVKLIEHHMNIPIVKPIGSFASN
jgi:hypothetical protein